MHLDVFYCPWDVLYQKIHNCHMGIVTGIDEEYVYVCDPYDRVVHEKLLIEDARKHSQFIYSYELEERSIARQEAKSIFRNEIVSEYRNTMIALKKSRECIVERLHMFANEEDVVFDLLFEFTRGRIIQYANFTYLFQYLASEEGQYEAMQESLNQIAKTLYRIKNLAVKLKISLNPVIVNSIHQFFESYLNQEDIFYHQLMEL